MHLSRCQRQIIGLDQLIGQELYANCSLTKSTQMPKVHSLVRIVLIMSTNQTTYRTMLLYLLQHLPVSIPCNHTIP